MLIRIVLLSLVLAACGSSSDTTTTTSAAETTTTVAETTTTVAEETTTTAVAVEETTTTAAAPATCPEATSGMSVRLIEVADELVGMSFDEVDQQFLSDLNQEMFDLGFVLGDTCGEDTGSAMSDVLVEVVAHGETEGGETQEVVGSLVGGICGNLGEIVLDDTGTEACATALGWLS